MRPRNKDVPRTETHRYVIDSHTLAVQRGAGSYLVGSLDRLGIRGREDLEVVGNALFRVDWVISTQHTVEEEIEMTIPDVADVPKTDFAVCFVGFGTPQWISVPERQELSGVDVPGLAHKSG